MANDPKPTPDVQILPPDRTLQKKLGTANLDQLLSPETIQQAQQVIINSSDKFLEESIAESEKLGQLAHNLSGEAGKVQQTLRDMGASAFRLKSSAGLGGYDLAASVAKSLHHYCEQLSEASAESVNLALVAWHIDSIEKLLTLKVKGAGGELGKAILAELNKLNATAGYSSAGDAP